MARSMNGINNIEVNNIEFPDGSTISSASNLVQLDTNNNFTGNNTYNTNLPTSDVNPDLVNINNNTILNRFSADKLYSTDANNFITSFSRNGTTGVITLQQADTGVPITTETYTSITDAQITAIGNAVLKTTAQEIDGVKTFVNFPEIKKVGQVVPSPTADEQFATKKYVDNAGGGGTGDALLSGGTALAPQTFIGFNKFDKDLILGDDLTMLSTTETINFTIEANATDSTTINQDAGFNTFNQKVKAGGTNRNVIEQDFFSNRTTGSINDFIQERSATNNIIQDGITNNIKQQNGDCVISQTGVNSTITTTGKMICATIPTGTDTTMLVNKTYVDGVASGSGSFRAFAVSHRINPASARSITNQSRFDPNVVVYQQPTTITMWDFGNNWHSITIAGYYSFYWGSAQFSGNTSTRLTIYRNGKVQNVVGNNTYMCGNQVSAVFMCDVGDQIQAGCEVNNMCYYAFCDTIDPNFRYNTFNGYLIQAI